MDIVRGHVSEVVFKHDASRIIQSIVKYGGSKERNEIALELKGQYQTLAQNKYSKVRSVMVLSIDSAHQLRSFLSQNSFGCVPTIGHPFY